MWTHYIQFICPSLLPFSPNMMSRQTLYELPWSVLLRWAKFLWNLLCLRPLRSERVQEFSLFPIHFYHPDYTNWINFTVFRRFKSDIWGHWGKYGTRSGIQMMIALICSNKSQAKKSYEREVSGAVNWQDRLWGWHSYAMKTHPNDKRLEWQ